MIARLALVVGLFFRMAPGVALGIAPDAASSASARDRVAPWQVRKLDVHGVSGVAFDPASGRLLGARARGALELLTIDPVGETILGPPARGGALRDARLAYDAATGRLLVLDATTGSLLDVPVSAGGRPDPTRARELDTVALGAGETTALALDPATGDLLLLEGSPGRIVRVERSVWSGEQAPSDAGIDAIEIDPALAVGGARGLAVHPGTGRLFVLDASGHALHELAPTGELVRSEDLSDLGLVDPRGITFAPSGDATDDPGRQSLYVADAGARPEGDPVRGERGGIVEVAVDRSLVSAAATLPTVVQTILTSQFVPPSPDPSGLGYDPLTDRLVISDGEVNEMAIFAGVNVWGVSRGGSVLATSDTLAFSDEPTGVAVDRPGNRYFFSDDTSPRGVYVVNLGADGTFDTADDTRTQVVTTAFGCSDPEGVAFDGAQQRLFVVSGVDAEVFTVRPGTNGVFDGVPPAGDDVVTQFDTEALGVVDPEGIEWDAERGTLFIADRTTRTVAETTPGGLLVNAFDLSFLGGNPAGLARAPATDLPDGDNLWLVDRAVDNDTDPNENDGKLYEIRLEPAPGSLSFQVAASTDDAEQRQSGQMLLASSDLELVQDGSQNQIVGMRFAGVTIPRGAPVLDAHLQFRVDEATSGATSLLIQGQLSNDAPTFTSTSGDLANRPRTVASVAWSPPPWPTVGSSGPDQRSPDVSPIVQEIVNRSGWTSGNALVLIVTGSGSRVADAYDGGAQNAPRLDVQIAPFVCGNSILELGEECDDGNTVAGDGCDPTCRITVACSDGVDNDRDLLTDFPNDPGCSSASDASERAVGDASLPCDNALDDDGDGFADYVDANGDGISEPPGDPGCKGPFATTENPQCQDGIDNDGAEGIDFDGGASIHGEPIDVPDPQCTTPSRGTESAARTCGLGFELAALLPALHAVRRRRGRGRLSTAGS